MIQYSTEGTLATVPRKQDVVCLQNPCLAGIGRGIEQFMYIYL